MLKSFHLFRSLWLTFKIETCFLAFIIITQIIAHETYECEGLDRSESIFDAKSLITTKSEFQPEGASEVKKEKRLYRIGKGGVIHSE